MSEKNQDDIRKRILFLSILLGAMAGIGIYLTVKVLASGNGVLLVALLPMALASVPLVKSLRELRRERARAIRGQEAT